MNLIAVSQLLGIEELGIMVFMSTYTIPNSRMFALGRLLEGSPLDGLVLNGDFIDFADTRGLNKLLKFSDRHGLSRIVAVLGNHEHYLSKNMIRRGLGSLAARDKVVDRLVGAGVCVLDKYR